MEYGYVKRKNTGGKKVKVTSRPYHYISSDGYDIYVGKNNFQNDELSFKFASGNDWWFHAKGQPGSHVIVKSKNEELPDRTFEEEMCIRDSDGTFPYNCNVFRRSCRTDDDVRRVRSFAATGYSAAASNVCR